MNVLALSSHARLALHWLRERDVPDTITVSTRAVLEKATITLRRGQYRDLHFLGGVMVSVEDYVAMINGKTATPFGAACELGVFVASRDEATIEAAREFGMHMGIAFQTSGPRHDHSEESGESYSRPPPGGRVECKPGGP